MDVLQHSLAKYALEISLLDFNLAPVSGSLLAAAALCLSLLLLEKSSSLETVWSPTLSYYSGYSAQEVLALVPRLASNLLKMNRANKLQAVRTKYKSGKFLKVSFHLSNNSFTERLLVHLQQLNLKVADIEELKCDRLVELAAAASSC